jgi:hypothetical protein
MFGDHLFWDVEFHNFSITKVDEIPDITGHKEVSVRCEASLEDIDD